MSKACCQGALSAFTVATLVCVLLMASPIAATQSPPVKIGGEVAVNSFAPYQQEYPDTTRRPDKKWIVVWSSFGQDGHREGIYMQLYNADRTKYSGEVRVNSITYQRQYVPRVAAAPDNSFVITWHSEHAGRLTVQSQRFSSSGSKVAREFTVNMGTTTAYYPDVTYLNSGDVVYCWREDPNSSSSYTMIRRYNSQFDALGAPVQVNDDPSQTLQLFPRITALAGGGFVVVYYGEHVGSDGTSVKGQLYTATATKVGAAFQVNPDGAGYERFPDVAAFPNGDFIVTWDYNPVDYRIKYHIVARRYGADGAPLGAVFAVSPERTQRPKVATFSDHSFVIVWLSDYHFVGMQYFDASENKVGSDTSLRVQESIGQSSPEIASSWDDGEFGVFYVSNVLGATSSDDIGVQWFVADVKPKFQVAPPCISACLEFVCSTGKIMDIKVTGVVSNDVWGSDYFSDDSNVAAAAVFAGLVADGESDTVTVKCSGPKPSFTSGSAHGVTTQAFASSWPSSFTFDLGGETQAPPPPSPPRCFHEPCAGGKCSVQGTSFDIIVEGVASNNVWGTEAFSDDSWVGAAAVHQGLLQAGTVGSVTVTCSGSRTTLTGSSQNGVTSSSFGPWRFTYVLHTGPTAAPAPTTDVCVGACLERNCPENRELFLRVHGATSGYLWGGSTLYSDDSTVCAAAVHAGLVAVGSTGIVKATCSGSQSTFTGSSQNGVTTTSWGPWPASFALSSGTGMPTVVCGPNEQCLKNECTVKGRVMKVSVTGSTHSATLFWGDHTLFSGDSPPSHAAVHAGLITDGETSVLYATCQGPHDSFPSSTTANGVTSTDWNTDWPGSFTLSISL